jgi:hypothetical protein
VLTHDGRGIEGPGTRLCVNPLSFRYDEVAVGARENRGAVFLDTDPPLYAPGFASGQCHEGSLVIREIGKSPRNFMSSLLDHALGVGNFHPIEYQLFFVDLRHNAAVRTEAWRRR